MTQIDRRMFLGLAIGGLAWACSPKGDGDSTEATDEPSGSAPISVLVGAPMLAIGDTRQAVVILRGQRPIKPDDLVVKLSGPRTDEPFTVEASHQQITRGLGGEEHSEDHTHSPGTEVEDIFVVRHDFDAAGTWDVHVSFEGGSGTAAFEVSEQSVAPKVGDKAIASDSPTTDDARDVDPICTRDPVCSMHDKTIKQALDLGKPLVISFATPRFCVSRACGPVVDLIEDEKDRVGDDCSFVHVEVWADDDEAVNQDPAPAFGEWKLDAEPWTYFVGADGVIKDRWLGPVGAKELSKAVDSLIA